MSDYNHKTDWYYEGNISQVIVSFLKLQSYKIIKDNSAKISERGEDIVASKEGTTLIVEVKGYPTEFHTKGVNKGKKKNTNPKLQAKHWLSEGLFTLMRCYSKYRGKQIEIALGLPKMPRYIELIKTIKPFLVDNEIALKILFVDQNNMVTEETFTAE